MRRPQIACVRQDPPSWDGRGRGVAEFEHPLEASDVEHFERESEGAGLIDSSRPESPDKAEQRVDPAHASPWQRTVEQGGGEAGDARTVCVGLRLQGLDIAQGVDAALDGIVVWVDRTAARWLTGMGFDEDAAVVEADQLGVGAGRQAAADLGVRNRVERASHLRQLVPRDFWRAP